MKLELFDFDLPERLIAQVPLEKRDASRLMVLNKQTGAITHDTFSQIINYFQKGDCLVLNNTRVLPARLFGMKEDTGAKVELLLLKQEEGDNWETLVKPAKRVKKGTVITFGDGRLKAVCTEEMEHGGRKVEFQYTGIFYEVLDPLVKCRCLHILKSSLTTVNAIKPFIQKRLAPLLRQLPVSTLQPSCWMR
ncbi:S-adenosylmethionine:tRNA ribosyltransferase-isomerase [Bacillus safensis subsp. safensis]